MVTLKELAERTGYSAATISRILTGDPALSVTPETRRKVLEEAGRLDYTTTRSSRGRTQKSVLRIGIAEMLTPTQQLEDPYYLYLGDRVRQLCTDRKYVCLPLACKEDRFCIPEGEKLDGIIAIGIFTPIQIESLAVISPNVVFVDSSPFESCFDSVVPGYELGISLALEHLEKLGHREICFLGPTYKLDDRRQRALEKRQQLFLKLTEKSDVYTPTLLECPMEVEAANKAVEQFLQSRSDIPSAFLCANEEIAIGALQAIGKQGIKIPEDIAIVSFNDTPRSALVEPSLTSVSLRVEEMSSTALRMLSERVARSNREPIRTVPLKVTVPPFLVIRQSTQSVKE